MIGIGDTVGGIALRNIGLLNSGAQATANFDYFIDLGSSMDGAVTMDAITLTGSMRSYDINSAGAPTNVFFGKISGRDAVRDVTFSATRTGVNGFEVSGYPYKSWLSNTFKTGLMAVDSVVTVCPDTFYGTLIISSNVCGSAVFELIVTPTLAMISNSTTGYYSTTKDTASHINVYIESNLVKIQNKVTNNFAAVVSFFLGNVY
jgi:hypothetical protein